jgi:hypothetical protein
MSKKYIYFYNDMLIKTSDEMVSKYINYEVRFIPLNRKYLGSCDNRNKGHKTRRNLNKRVSYVVKNNEVLIEDMKRFNSDLNDIVVNITATHETAFETLINERYLLKKNPNKYYYNTSTGGEGIKYSLESPLKILEESLYLLKEYDQELFKKIVNDLKKKNMIL